MADNWDSPVPVPDGKGGIQYVDPTTYQASNPTKTGQPVYSGQSIPSSSQSPSPQNTPTPGVGDAFGAPNSWDNPQARQNLQRFGYALMAAGGRPGATFLGSIGEAGMNAQDYNQGASRNYAGIGLTNAEANYYGAHSRQVNVGTNLQLQQLNFQRMLLGQPPLDANGNVMSGASGAASGPGSTSSSPATVGMSQAPSAGASHGGIDPGIGTSGTPAQVAGANTAVSTPAGRSAAAFNTQPVVQSGAPLQAPIPSTPGPFGIPNEVWQGQIAPTKPQAATMARVYDFAGMKDQAQRYYGYAMQTEPGFGLGPGYTQFPIAGGPASMPYIQQKSAAEAWGQVDPHIAEAWGKPNDLRPGNVLTQYGRPIYQAPQAIERTDPNTGRVYTDYVQPAMGGNAGNVSAVPLVPSPRGMAFRPVPAVAPSANLPPGTTGADVATGRVASPGSLAAPGVPTAGTILTKQSPREIAEGTERGKQLGEDLGKIDEAGGAAQQVNFLLDNMKGDSQSWRMGKFADIQNDAAGYLQAFSESFGLDTPNLNKRVGDFQAFVKSAGTIARQATKEVSSRASFQEMNFISNTLPNPEMTQNGFDQVRNQMGAVNDFRLAKMVAAHQWKDSHGTLEGFDADFTSNVSPGAFLFRRLDDASARQFTAAAQKTPEGKATLARIKQQYLYAQKNGLFE